MSNKPIDKNQEQLNSQKKNVDNNKPTLQDLIKEQVKKDANTEAMKTRCRVPSCHKEIYPIRKCPGHGGGGGGGGGGGESKEAASTLATLIKIPTDAHGNVDLDETIEAKEAVNYRSDTAEDNEEKLFETELSEELEKLFDRDVISQMLTDRMLMIDSDKNLGILTIKLRVPHSSLTEEQKVALQDFMASILEALQEFKTKNGISSQDPEIVTGKDNDQDEPHIISLRIMLPTPGVYAAFIQHLQSKFLLPMQNIYQDDNKKVEYPEGMNHFTNKPLSIKPTPGNRKLKSLEEEHKTTTPKALSTILKPKDFT